MILLHEVKIFKLAHELRYRFADSSKSTVIVYLFFFTLFSLCFIQAKEYQSNATLLF